MKIHQINIPNFTRRKTHHLSLASRFRLVANYLEGMSFKEIEVIYGVHEETIRNIARRFGCSARPRYFKNKVIDEWRAKYAYD